MQKQKEAEEEEEISYMWPVKRLKWWKMQFEASQRLWAAASQNSELDFFIMW